MPLLAEPMATQDDPHRSPTQASLQALRWVLQTGYCPKVLLGHPQSQHPSRSFVHGSGGGAPGTSRPEG